MNNLKTSRVLVTGAGRGGTNLLLEAIRGLGIPATAEVEDRNFFSRNLPSCYLTKLATDNTSFTFENLLDKMETYLDLKVIFVTRHPFDNILSKVRRGQPSSLGGDQRGEQVMPDGTFEGALKAVSFMYDILSKIKNTKYKDRVFTVKMEDLILEPRGTVDRLGSFLGLQPSDESYEFYKHNRNRYQQARYSNELNTEQTNLYQNLYKNFDSFFIKQHVPSLKIQGQENILDFLYEKAADLALSNGYELSERNNKLDKVYFGINGLFGDIIIQEPSLRKFIQDNPKTKIVLGCHEKYSDILDLYQGYHENIVSFKSWQGYKNWPSNEDLKYIMEQNFDKVFCAQPKHDTIDWVKERHITQESGFMQGISVVDTQIKLPVPNDIIKSEKTVCISLFPSWPTPTIKAFSYEHVCNIVKIINKLGYKVLHLNGPDEPDVPNTTKINGSFKDSVRYLLGSDLLVTCDTAMSWVASAFQHPTVGFWAINANPYSGVSKNWQPVNPNATYLEAPVAMMIEKRDIVKALYDALGGK